MYSKPKNLRCRMFESNDLRTFSLNDCTRLVRSSALLGVRFALSVLFSSNKQLGSALLPALEMSVCSSLLTDIVSVCSSLLTDSVSVSLSLLTDRVSVSSSKFCSPVVD
uniref:Uncharacterized protein n=1 Tax=Cacopsylla melanoneura TaxID=428564 RepID=A0A8D8MC37_9HEMI